MAKKIKHETQPDMFAVLEHQERTAHFPAPGDWDGAAAQWRGLIDRYHSAMLAGDTAAAVAVQDEAHLLAEHMHGGSCGCVSAIDRLQAATCAAVGSVPMWGQSGEWVLTWGESLPVRIEIDGLCAIASFNSLLPWFSLNIVDKTRLFFSETGYRSCFSGLTHAVAGLSLEDAIRTYLGHHLKGEMKGKLVPYVSPEESRARQEAQHAKWRAEEEQRAARRAAGDVDAEEEEEEEDAAELCAGCGLDLSQLDSYFECSEDGGLYCEGCHSDHKQSCPSCAELYAEEVAA